MASQKNIELLEKLFEEQFDEKISEFYDVNEDWEPFYNKKLSDFIYYNNEIYRYFLQNSVKHHISLYNMKRIMKIPFFIITMLILLVVSIAPIVLVFIFVFAKNDINTITAVSSMVTAIVTSISSIIVLPKTIAEHLFPKDDESNIQLLIKVMQENDEKLINHNFKDEINEENH